MPLPIKSRYTIAEAAKFIKCATGEAVTQSQILDWGTQGLYKLHLAIEHCSIRPIGETEIIKVRDSIIELRLTGGQAAILGRGERVGISECWHNGAACKFMRQRTGDYSGWTPDTVYFGAAALVFLGAELATFTASITEPQQTAPAPDTATHAPAPVGAVGASVVVHSTKVRRDTLTPVIELAQKQCRNPQDTAEVWAALLVLAENKQSHLLGVTEDGLQYLDKGSAAIFTKRSLSKRLNR